MVHVVDRLCSSDSIQISTPKAPSHHALHVKCALSRPTIRATLPINARGVQKPRNASQVTTSEVNSQEVDLRTVRLPKAVQAVFLAPLKRAPTHGIPVCDLQIRSYSVRNLEAFTDFCLRAAYYLGLPAKGPVPLPRITERWTVPRSNFVHKKSQENFERITMRRLIQIQDGHLDTVAIWLAYIQKQRYYGVGMKANVFQHSELDAVQSMEKVREESWSSPMTRRLRRVARNSALDATHEDTALDQAYHLKAIEQPFKAQWGSWSGMGGLQDQPSGRRRFLRKRLARPLKTQTKSRESAEPSI